MRILAHKCNSPAAFRAALLAGFGAELDIRDAGNRLVVSHDLPASRPAELGRFFETYAALKSELPLALNIKSCGLQKPLLALLKKFGIGRYFVFDMAVPDGLDYLKNKIRVFTRQSEYESAPAYYDLAAGVWLDEFRGHWISGAVIRRHLKNNKQVCVVSPELHKRSYETEWADLKRTEKSLERGALMLCTDHPARASRYFNG